MLFSCSSNHCPCFACLWCALVYALLYCNSIPQEMKDIYKTVWEIKMKSVIDLAADRGAFVDQSQVRKNVTARRAKKLKITNPSTARLVSGVTSRRARKEQFATSNRIDARADF